MLRRRLEGVVDADVLTPQESTTVLVVDEAINVVDALEVSTDAAVDDVESATAAADASAAARFRAGLWVETGR